MRTAEEQALAIRASVARLKRAHEDEARELALRVPGARIVASGVSFIDLPLDVFAALDPTDVQIASWAREVGGERAHGRIGEIGSHGTAQAWTVTYHATVPPPPPQPPPVTDWRERAGLTTSVQVEEAACS